MSRALLVLEDGRTFTGEPYGAHGETFGEAVFSTGMTGYQETLTDPSYHRQVVVQTAPHIGNTGVNDEDPESSRIWVSGYVVRDPARRPSNWRATRALPDELAKVPDLWLVTHGDLRQAARIRAFMDFMADSIRTDRAFLEGRRRKSALAA